MDRLEPDKHPSRTIKWIFGIMIVIFFLTLGGFAYVITGISDLGQKNKDRISDIQVSRIESCKITYTGIKKAFIPLFPPKPRPKKQQADIDKFVKNLDDLKKNCKAQILAPDVPEVHPADGR